MSRADLKVVGEIAPPDYMDPVKMLRNLADEIEANSHGIVHTVAIATFGDAGLEVYGGGDDSAGPTIAMLFRPHLCKCAIRSFNFERAVNEPRY